MNPGTPTFKAHLETLTQPAFGVVPARSMFPVEQAVPLPPILGAGIARKLYHTLFAMKPGDSFVFDHDNKSPYRAAKRLGIKIVMRKLEHGGWRVWRTT